MGPEQASPNGNGAKSAGFGLGLGAPGTPDLAPHSVEVVRTAAALRVQEEEFTGATAGGEGGAHGSAEKMSTVTDEISASQKTETWAMEGSRWITSTESDSTLAGNSRGRMLISETAEPSIEQLTSRTVTESVDLKGSRIETLD